MIEPLEQLAIWREEVSTEIEAAQRQLATALAEQVAAEAEQRAAAVSHQEWRTALEPLKAPISSALAARLSTFPDGMRVADGRLSMAKSAVASARYVLEDLMQASSELATVAPKPEAIPVPAEELVDVV